MVEFNRKRRNLTLGRIKRATADRFSSNIDELIAYRKLESSALPPQLEIWVKSLSEKHLKQLGDIALIGEISQTLTIGKLISAKSGKQTISTLADQYIRTRGAGQEESTIDIYNRSKRNLLDCFGDVDATLVKPSDAREFWRWLLEEGSQAKGSLASNTAKQRLRFARAFFEQAVEDGLIGKNPFKINGLTTTQSAAEKEYIPRLAIEKVIKHCPTAQWKTLFALARTIPVRIPSEIKELAWSDIDWAENRLLIHSPKTRKIGKSARYVPIFPLLAKWLGVLFDEAEKDAIYVLPNIRTHSNPATTAAKYVKKAKIKPWIDKPWVNFWNSLRATTETDLMDEYGLRRACQWSGNTAATAEKNYALVRKTDFQDIGNSTRTQTPSEKPNQTQQV